MERILPEQIEDYVIEDNLTDQDIDFILDANESTQKTSLVPTLNRAVLRSSFMNPLSKRFRKDQIDSKYLSSYFNKFDRESAPSRRFSFYLMTGPALEREGVRDESLRVYMADMLADSPVAPVQDVYSWKSKAVKSSDKKSPPVLGEYDYWVSSGEVPYVNSEAIADMALETQDVLDIPLIRESDERKQFKALRERADYALLMAGLFSATPQAVFANRWLKYASSAYADLQVNPVVMEKRASGLFGELSQNALPMAKAINFMGKHLMEVHPELIKAGYEF